jgi:hypothetical protein
MADKIDWRGMFKRVVARMRETGESNEMGARWMAEEANTAVFNITEENKRLREIEEALIAPESGVGIEGVLVNYRRIRRAAQDSRAAASPSLSQE